MPSLYAPIAHVCGLMTAFACTSYPSGVGSLRWLRCVEACLFSREQVVVAGDDLERAANHTRSG